MPARPVRRLAFRLAVASLGALGGLLGGAAEARADDATVSVNGQFADPPPQRRVVVSADDAFIAREPELRRSVVRFELGPVGLTSGKGFGYGLQTGISLGTGSVGGRFYAAWMRGEGGDDNHRGAATGESLDAVLAHYRDRVSGFAVNKMPDTSEATMRCTTTASATESGLM